MNLAEKAYESLFPNKKETRRFVLKYSAKFKPFNANAKYDSEKIVFSISKNWEEFSEELRIGLIQSLLIRIIKQDYDETFELDLYNKFIKNLPNYSKIDKSDPELLNSFNKINKDYFNEEINTPNLVWGTNSFNKLGHYEYTTDTIMISTVLKGEQELLDYVVFHEALHKKLGYKKTKTGRMTHHSKEFKQEEAKYKTKDIEKKLRNYLRKKKLIKALKFF
ncbi:hypothetical protein KO361_01465 [Candidatus Woesearchaeota archaeon]|nr:hypothetical protein [Candidatus Woesearchaeota archaeon]